MAEEPLSSSGNLNVTSWRRSRESIARDGGRGSIPHPCVSGGSGRSHVVEVANRRGVSAPECSSTNRCGAPHLSHGRASDGEDSGLLAPETEGRVNTRPCAGVPSGMRGPRGPEVHRELNQQGIRVQETGSEPRVRACRLQARLRSSPSGPLRAVHWRPLTLF